MVPTNELREIVSEMVRVAAPGGTVAWWLPTASSFGEFFSVFWEALLTADLEDHGVDVEYLITDVPTVSDLEKLAKDEGLEHVQSWTTIEEFDYPSGEKFLNSPLINDFLLPAWLSSVPEAARPRVQEELARIIDEERHAGEFPLTMKATLVMGEKVTRAIKKARRYFAPSDSAVERRGSTLDLLRAIRLQLLRAAARLFKQGFVVNCIQLARARSVALAFVQTFAKRFLALPKRFG
jgi:hypothetical protein